MTTTFDDAIRGLRATGASVSTYKVVGVLERHGREEGELLEQYQRFADEAESPMARYLVKLIIEDERRHHRVLEDLANTVAWGRINAGPTDVVPVYPEAIASDSALKSETRKLLRHELHDRTALRRLRRRLRSFGDAPLWVLLIDLMLADTAKHIKILRFVLRGEGAGRRLWSRLLGR
jgi:hypothetical protein